MIKIYGMSTCPDCSYLFDQIKGREAEFEYIEIGEHILKIKEFIHIRDNNEIFKDVAAAGGVGLPCFLFEDGRVSLTPEDAGLESNPE